MLSTGERRKYMQAGAIAAGIRTDMLKSMRVGDNLLSIAGKIEAAVAKAGAKPAFPVNISINEAAAHYTPPAGEQRTIGKGDLVKVDIGAHIDGYLADLAFTWCSEKSPLIKAAQDALAAGISVIRPGATVSEISAAIYGSIEKSGFAPVVNLSGHGIGRYDFHGKVSIPNVPNDNSYAFKEGEVLALEPFVAQSAVHVDESGPAEIYQFVQRRPVRMPEARRVMDLAEKDFASFPFAKRWLSGKVPPLRLNMALIELERCGAIRSYPVLKDMQGRKIAQAEDTIIVAEKPIVTTRA
jgi:methionyl aminopeptidase